MFQHSGEAKIVVPGQPEASRTVAPRFATVADDERMPPPESGKSLSGPKRELSAAWIIEGAVWREHWSFGPLTRPAPPEEKDVNGSTSALDRFLLARLAARGCNPPRLPIRGPSSGATRPT